MKYIERFAKLGCISFTNTFKTDWTGFERLEELFMILRLGCMEPEVVAKCEVS